MTLYRIEIEAYTYVAAASRGEAEAWVREHIGDLRDEIAESYVVAREVGSLNEVESDERRNLPWNAEDDKTIAEYFAPVESPKEE